MFENRIPARPDTSNLKNYDEMNEKFLWNDINREFSWHTTHKLNIAYEAIDRHAENPEKANHNCVIYSHGQRKEKITFRTMRILSNKLGNVLRGLGVIKGDRVCLFLPRIPELYVALAGCAKVGAIIVPLYTNFRKNAIEERMRDAEPKVLITTPRYCERVCIDEYPNLSMIILVGGELTDEQEKKVLWDKELSKASDKLDIEWVEKDTPLFLIYTTGKDEKTVGLIHTHDAMRGYLMTSRWVLDLKEGDVLWTQTRPGWLLNVVYSAFAPWLCGVGSFVTGEINTADVLYQYIEEFSITVLYTLPTIYRMIVNAGEEIPKKFDLKSLRHLNSVLEPLQPDVIYAVMRILGLPIYDTWWTAETGMITIANFPCLPIKPGFMGKPFPGIQAAILDSEAREVQPFNMGNLCLKPGWPAMMRSIWRKDHHSHVYIHNNTRTQ